MNAKRKDKFIVFLVAVLEVLFPHPFDDVRINEPITAVVTWGERRPVVKVPICRNSDKGGHFGIGHAFHPVTGVSGRVMVTLVGRCDSTVVAVRSHVQLAVVMHERVVILYAHFLKKMHGSGGCCECWSCPSGGLLAEEGREYIYRFSEDVAFLVFGEV